MPFLFVLTCHHYLCLYLWNTPQIGKKKKSLLVPPGPFFPISHLALTYGTQMYYSHVIQLLAECRYLICDDLTVINCSLPPDSLSTHPSEPGVAFLQQDSHKIILASGSRGTEEAEGTVWHNISVPLPSIFREHYVICNSVNFTSDMFFLTDQYISSLLHLLFQSSSPCQDTAKQNLFSIGMSYESEDNSLPILSKLYEQNTYIQKENGRIFFKKKSASKL